MREDDLAAATTIKELNLDHDELRDLRRAAIRGTITPKNQPLTLAKARHLLNTLLRPVDGDLAPFHFALKQAVENYIRSLETATATGAAKRRS